MHHILVLTFSILLSCSALAETTSKNRNIERAVLDYIESQHKVQPELIKRGLDKKLAKRTYWKSKDGSEYIKETDFDTMVWLAENYNKKGDKFSSSPMVDIKIFDVDNRVASVKLTVND